MSELKETKRVIGPKDFIRTYECCNSNAEAAERLGMTESEVVTRASFYRQQGVNLKKMKVGRPALDIAALNEIIDRIRAEQQAAQSLTIVVQRDVAPERQIAPPVKTSDKVREMLEKLKVKH